MLVRLTVPAYLLAILTLSVFEAPRAHAACFEIVGCTGRDRISPDALSRFSCQNLAFLRNSIYAENGYCFKSPEYRTVFIRENCLYEQSEDAPLNEVERANVLAILAVEREKGCRR